jgi:hypothetical protein
MGDDANSIPSFLRDFSPPANYTDWAVATCRRSYLQFFADIGVSRGYRGGSLTALISVFETEAATFSSKQLLNCTHEAEWTPFQAHHF